MVDQDPWTGFVFSRPPARRTMASAASYTIAVGTHVALLVLAVTFTRPEARVAAAPEEQITLIQLELDPTPLVETPPPPPAPEPPPAAPPPPARPVPPPQPAAPALPAAPSVVEPQGFQTLAQPDLKLTEIPPPAAAALREEDFGGVGAAGGRASASAVAADTLAQGGAALAEGDGPRLSEMTTPPRLKNDKTVRYALEQQAEVLRHTTRQGTTVVWLRLDEQGRVVRTQVRTSSGDDVLDESALRVARVMRFTPAKYGDQAIPAWIHVPVIFQVR